MSSLSSVKITVLDSATLFEGIDTIYRYDMPGTGVEEGWAVNAVIDQIRDMYGAVWPDVEVVIDGSEAATDMLSRTLLNKGVTAYSIEALTDPVIQESGSQPSHEDLFQIRRPTEHTRQSPFTRFHAVLAGIGVVIVGGVVLLVGNSMRTDVPAHSHAATVSTAAHALGNGASSPATSTRRKQEVPPSRVLEYQNVVFSVPQGFKLEPRDDGLLVATGDDPNLRILVAADPIHNVDPAAVRREVEEMVEHDPQLTAQSDEQMRGPEIVTQTYREDPGDGSSVLWVTWVQQNNQVSVGCHSKTNATIPQKAACRMAVETLQLKN